MCIRDRFTSIGESKIPLGLLIFSSILNIAMDLWLEMCIRDRTTTVQELGLYMAGAKKKEAK